MPVSRQPEHKPSGSSSWRSDSSGPVYKGEDVTLFEYNSGDRFDPEDFTRNSTATYRSHS